MKNQTKRISILTIVIVMIAMLTGNMLVGAAIPSTAIPYTVSVNGNTYQGGSTILEEDVTFYKGATTQRKTLYVSGQYDFPCYVIAVRTRVPSSDYMGGAMSGDVRIGYNGSAFYNSNAMLVPINPSISTFGNVQLYVFENPYPAYRDFTISIEANTGANNGAEIEITVMGKIK